MRRELASKYLVRLLFCLPLTAPATKLLLAERHPELTQITQLVEQQRVRLLPPREHPSDLAMRQAEIERGSHLTYVIPHLIIARGCRKLFFSEFASSRTPQPFATRGARDGERSGRELREQSILRSLNGGKKVSNIYSKARGTCQDARVVAFDFARPGFVHGEGDGMPGRIGFIGSRRNNPPKTAGESGIP